MALTISQETEQLLVSEATRTGVPVTELLHRAIVAHFATAPNPPSDAELERVARQEPAQHLRDAYLALALKQRQERGLSEAERDELLRLLEHLDTHHVRRMEAAAELAKRGNLTLRVCMERFGIRPLELIG
nr:hypothetical protein [Armatimonas sp.]